MVKAKFYVANVAVSSIDEDGNPKMGSVDMQAVTRGAANKRWAAYTPSGNFKMQINSSALQWFMKRVGKEVSITLEDAGADPATHEFSPLEDEFQSPHAREDTCAECGRSEAEHA
jgi:hypothetical protein